MDAHVFRLVAAALNRLLSGGRVEKIYGPMTDVYVFTLFAQRIKHRLVLRSGRQSPMLFLGTRPLSNPARPPARIMRLRKYCQGRRLGPGIVDFAARRMAFPLGVFSPGDGGALAAPDGGGVFSRPPEAWLLLDLRTGADVVFALPPAFGDDPIWPEADTVDSLCARPWNKKEAAGPWLDHAVLTPLLRESLAALDVMEGRALMVDLEAGGGGLYPYADASGHLSLYCAWPLPEAALLRRGLALWREADGGESAGMETQALGAIPPGGGASCDALIAGEAVGQAEKRGRIPGGSPGAHIVREAVGAVPPLGGPDQGQNGSLGAEFAPSYGARALALVSRVDEARFFHELGQRLESERQLPERRENKRLAGLPARLDQEEARLKGLAALRGDAIRLQALLWQYPPDARLENVPLPADQEQGGAPGVLELDPLLTLRENMARMFHVSDRAARGLSHVRRRREELVGRANGARDLPVTAAGGRGGVSLGRTTGERRDPACSEGRVRQAPPAERAARSIKDVSSFLSSDGFTLLRGKSARGNQALLQLGRPHDLWLHAQDGPSAHLIIRRSHADMDIPERTLLEAAALVGEKSWQRHEEKAHVMVALLRHVHALKGAEPGTVRVDAIMRTVTVRLK